MTLTEKLLLLHEAPAMTWKRLMAVYQQDSTFQLPFHMPPHHLSRFFHLNPRQAASLYRFLHSRSPSEKLHHYKKANIHVLTPFHPQFPERLKQMHDPPWILYAKGNLDLLHAANSLAVVGTRKLTEYGKMAMRVLLPPLLEERVTIVSGLAAGTDTYAHMLAVQHHGTTIAVLGSGFDHIYPKGNMQLAGILAAKHLLISEYPPDLPPRKWHFPMRNRLISALSDITFITEAGKRSGSLITAHQALEQGRDVRVLPGSIFSPMSKGTNELLSEGAALVAKSEDLWCDRWKKL
ncbi:DNA processing protein [Alteribacillus persepolensis]|uniref:DNA processing protein n=1 Tax=Alteribacillus persepolensis TaxID=568899 RepID=A0A1G7YLT5_9BACI|nr:DNA-processing protein DprA [Alteribacillus persepolensis]SDG97488.1 DNA processing protein [Alteribacillus persepolensis]